MIITIIILAALLLILSLLYVSAFSRVSRQRDYFWKMYYHEYRKRREESAKLWSAIRNRKEQNRQLKTSLERREQLLQKRGRG